MPRFRLRFLLQEFDLPVGEILIGRSPDCHITIEDPLISRTHAKVQVSASEAIWHDLGSRNGSRINGKSLQGPVVLRDADRIRLGAQELVFFQVGTDRRPPRQTGALRYCAQCNTPYPEGPRACPHCGFNQIAGTLEDETLAGLHAEPRRTWMLQLMGEVLERALATRRLPEAERILERAAGEVEERLANGETLEPKQIQQVADYAFRIALLQRTTRWFAWGLQILARTGRLPVVELIHRLESGLDIPGLAPLVREYVLGWTSREATLSPEESASLRALEGLVQRLGT